MVSPTFHVITNDEVSMKVLEIIRGAKEYVFLVSPYIDFWEHLKTAIAGARRAGVDITFVHRHEEGTGNTRSSAKAREDLAWLRAQGVKVYAVPHLHAKIYYNESTALLTSMNLLLSSMSNSREVGVVIPQESAADLRAYVEHLRGEAKAPVVAATKAASAGDRPRPQREEQPVGAGHPGRPTKPPSLAQEAAKVFKGVLGALKSDGHCIRCGDSLPDNSNKPLCPKCFAKWSVYENPDYPEAYCHRCGHKRKTSFAKPLCAACYAAA